MILEIRLTNQNSKSYVNDFIKGTKTKNKYAFELETDLH